MQIEWHPLRLPLEMPCSVNHPLTPQLRTPLTAHDPSAHYNKFIHLASEGFYCLRLLPSPLLSSSPILYRHLLPPALGLWRRATSLMRVFLLPTNSLLLLSILRVFHGTSSFVGFLALIVYPLYHAHFSQPFVPSCYQAPEKSGHLLVWANTFPKLLGPIAAVCPRQRTHSQIEKLSLNQLYVPSHLDQASQNPAPSMLSWLLLEYVAWVLQLSKERAYQAQFVPSQVS